jgi:hypothetical protein
MCIKLSILGFVVRGGSARLSTEALEAQKVAQGVVSWIDSVDQSSIEQEVMQVVESEGWQVVNAAAAGLEGGMGVTAAIAASTVAVPTVQSSTAQSSTAKLLEATPLVAVSKAVSSAVVPSARVPVQASATVPAVAAHTPVPTTNDTPQSAKRTRSNAPSPAVAFGVAQHSVNVSTVAAPTTSATPLKRKATDTPGSVTRSGAKRAALHISHRVEGPSFAIFADPPAVSAPASAMSATAAAVEARPTVYTTAVGTHSVPSPAAPSVVPAELKLVSALSSTTATTATTAPQGSALSGGAARTSSWAPVSISRPPPANLAGAASLTAAASTSQGSAQSGAAVKTFNPKPAFLSNILGSSSRVTSFIGASSAGSSSSSAEASTTASRSANASASMSSSAVPIARSSAPTTKRSPLKAMPLTLQQQIQIRAGQRLNSTHGANDGPHGSGAVNKEGAVDRAAKWVKPAPVEEPNNLQQSLERQLGALR